MENRGLLFIPDISGFTRFINETEIEHSRLIIQELLELLISANETGLEISEIEGDAILFYKFGDPPSLEDIYQQVQNMFCAFHRHLLAYEYRRYCQCKACTSAVQLSLKVVTHYGEFTGYNVRNFFKLLGKDVIVAHQLLKNDIDQHEYWLVTDSLVPQEPPQLAGWMQWNSSRKQTETGIVPFRYTQLAPLRNEVQPEVAPALKLDQKIKIASASRDYETGIIPLFHASGDFNYRSRWQEGIVSIEELSHFLPRVGMRCRCTLDSGETMVFSNSYSFSPHRIEFSETQEKDNHTRYYTIESVGDNRTRLTLDYYVPRGLLDLMLFRRKKGERVQKSLARSLQNLEALVIDVNKKFAARTEQTPDRLP